MKCSFGISNYLEEISTLSHSIVFLYFFVLITEGCFLLSLLAILWNSAFKWVYLSLSPLLFTSLIFIAICKDSLDSHFAYIFFLVIFEGSSTLYFPFSYQIETLTRDSLILNLETLSPGLCHEGMRPEVREENNRNSFGIWKNYDESKQGIDFPIPTLMML